MMLDAEPIQQFVRLGLHIPAQVLVLVTLAAYLLGFRVRGWWAWSVAALGAGAFTCSWVVNYPPPGTDILYFWRAGCDIVAGQDPYRNPFCLNPPTALPLFGLFGLFAFPLLQASWLCVNALGLVGLVVSAHALLARGAGSEKWLLPTPMIGVVTAALLLSTAAHLGLFVGQLSVLVSLALVLALLGQQANKPFLSGLCLAIASVKPATMVPFLMLFLRRRDWRIWGWLTVTGFALTFLLTSPLELPHRLQESLANIGIQAEAGGMNQPAHHVNVDLIGIDRALFYCGMSDRGAVQLAHGVIVLLLLSWVAWQVRGPRALEGPAAWSLAAMGSMLFLYHRIYDLPVLVVALMYVLGRTRAERGACRWFYGGCVAAVLGLLYFRYDTVKLFCYHPPFGGLIGQVANALVVPNTVWLLFAGMFCLTIGERLRMRAEGIVGDQRPKLASDVMVEYRRIDAPTRPALSVDSPARPAQAFRRTLHNG